MTKTTKKPGGWSAVRQQIATWKKPALLALVKDLYAAAGVNRNFLLQNHDTEDREYPGAADQIREVLIHGHYLSRKDVEICLSFDLSGLAGRPEINSIRTLHEALKSEYGPT